MKSNAPTQTQNRSCPDSTPMAFPHKPESLTAWNGVIYQSASRGRQYYKLVYRAEGKRKTLGYDSIEATMKGVSALVRKLGTAKAGEVVLSNGEGARYEQAMATLAELKDAPALNIAIADYVAARKILGDVSLTDAARFYEKRRGLNLPARTVTKVVEEMIVAKRAEKLSPRHVKDLENRLARFGRDFQCQIADIDSTKLSAWLRGLNLSPRSQNNFRGAIQNLMAFAKSCGYLVRDWDELDTVPLVKDKEGDVETFTPEEISKLLSHASEQVLAFVLIGAFAGLRSAEIGRLTWDKIDLKRGYITLDAKICKTNARRVVPIQPNLKEWLAPLMQKEGRVCEYGQIVRALPKLAASAGVEWKQNALRHSYASYRLSVTQDAPKVALEMGNSPAMIQRHYRELKTPECGATWFAISPGVQMNVVALAG